LFEAICKVIDDDNDDGDVDYLCSLQPQRRVRMLREDVRF